MLTFYSSCTDDVFVWALLWRYSNIFLEHSNPIFRQNPSPNCDDADDNEDQGKTQMVSSPVDCVLSDYVIIIDARTLAGWLGGWLVDRSLITSCRPTSPAPDSRLTRRYDTRCYFNVCSKANMSQLNLPHRTDN